MVCTYTNTKSASLTVVKVTDPASDPQDFDFDLTGSGVPADLDLDTDGGDATLPSQDAFTLDASELGAHTVTESAQAGWDLTNLVCTGAGGDSSTNLVDRKATLDIDAGETVVCTFTNTKHASLTVVKATVPASDPQDFDFDLTGSGVPADLDLDTDAASAGTPSQDSFSLDASELGAHTVTESELPDWDLTALECIGRRRRFLDEPRRSQGDARHRRGRERRLHVHEHEARLAEGRQGHGPGFGSAGLRLRPHGVGRAGGPGPGHRRR